MSSLSNLADEPIRLLTVGEYHQLADTGAFEGERVELLHGVVVRMSPQRPPHATVIVTLTRLFARQLGDEVELRIQLPLQTDEHGEPEPDLALCLPRPDRETAHPRTAALVVEVCETTRKRDLVTKPALYAAAGVLEYWVVDVTRRALHVHRRPAENVYERVEILHPGEVVSPVAFPGLAIDVGAMLPRPE